MNFLDEAKRRIALAVKANESAPEPDDAELKFRKGMAMVLESLDKVDSKLVQEMMVVLMDQLERRFAGKQQEQPEEQQPAANAQRGPKTPDLESYFSTPTRKTDTRTPDIGSYFE
ncbi:TPA: hypothetical protein KUM87_001395 [Escherichia coli]|uniref:hypothetical protein n=1 Tax=Escherichia coli TaxID=562 RepID=UPI000BE93521|nr:hypothetical protein [Escherichia coli]EFC0383745.1 hypothetical protein [Escherichia coli]EFH9986364.1 hypothetical protein [Escherichia coli]EFI0001681.1 hypothetical protein [Escherichia coli]EFJ3896252.1 hypothetical protein [Escherichia coli]EFJ6703446.1 hypothetical protein [Escherichia coli]